MYPYDNDDRFGTGNQTPPETTPQTPTPDDTPDVTSDNIPTPLYGDDSGWQMPTDNAARRTGTAGGSRTTRGAHPTGHSLLSVHLVSLYDRTHL